MAAPARAAAVFPLSAMKTDGEIAGEAQKLKLSLSPGELRKISALLGRDPYIVECFVFDIEWSEHCSYKSSRDLLKKYFPFTAPNVIIGIGEDAGIIRFTEANGVEYGLVVSHESHNHPSQVLPSEGAGTGVGGIVRDVDCMGARVVGIADSLRFGDIRGPKAAKARWIASGVVDGIWEYANALGVPSMGGDACYDASYNENCLVNVCALGIVRTDRIIRSRAPSGAAKIKHDIILAGKPTDASGFGGAAFASVALEGDNADNKGAVQVPDPFLKNVLLLRKANEAVFTMAAEKQVEIGMKDIGAGGIACATAETAAAAGFGAEIDLGLVHTSEGGLPPEVIACAETQERYILIVPEDITPEVLAIYNGEWALPEISEGARASVIGKITPGKRYVLKHRGLAVCDVPISGLTGGISYDRKSGGLASGFAEPEFDAPADTGAVLLGMLGSENTCSRAYIYENYDTEVQGRAVLRPGEADAGVIAPLAGEGSSAGAALSVDGNPFYGKIDPYLGAVNAVSESMRNVAAVGASPACLTDCLNYGNPENPEAFRQFSEGVRGIADAARNLWMKGMPGIPVPIISGNVSFYNESRGGQAIAPSPVAACVGIMEDFSAALSMRFKREGSLICAAGPRYDELGGSEYYRVYLRAEGKNVPEVRFEQERNTLYAVIDCIGQKLLLACHDISGGGLGVAASEMLMPAGGGLGARINLDAVAGDLRPDKKLFSESSGFVMEIPEQNFSRAETVFSGYGMVLYKAGRVTGDGRLRIFSSGAPLVELAVAEMLGQWGKSP